jgi:DNA-binding CsgD family transcriptional regulator
MPAQNSLPQGKTNPLSAQTLEAGKEEFQLLQKQKELELLVEKNEKKIFKLQTFLYISFILLLIVSLSTLFFWNTSKNKIIQLKIERELSEKQRAYRKSDSAISSLTKFALQEESGTVKSVKDELIFKLSRTHPALTDKDHQLCTLLMLNLSSKEMASILNIQEESVEKSRSRLRKKMNLDSSQNFIEYFNSIK